MVLEVFRDTNVFSSIQDSEVFQDWIILADCQDHQGNSTCFFEFFRDLKKCEKTDKSKKGLKVTKLTTTFLCWVDCLKKALFGSF